MSSTAPVFLGLATVYGIAKNHGGHINVYSEPGEGTTFSLYLPASDKEIVEPEQETVNIMGDATILIVDDEEHVRNLAAGMLEQLGYKTMLARNGEEAISIYLKNVKVVDLVVLDIIMPVMDGKETFLRLNNINPEVKVVLTSGYAQNGKATEILMQGAAGFVQKPFRIGELSKQIAIALQ